MPAAPSPIHGRRLEALLACAANPQGLRPSAYPTVMPVLIAMGLVERLTPPSQAGRPALLFLTAAGRRAVEKFATEEPGAPAV